MIHWSEALQAQINLWLWGMRYQVHSGRDRDNVIAWISIPQGEQETSIVAYINLQAILLAKTLMLNQSLKITVGKVELMVLFNLGLLETILIDHCHLDVGTQVVETIHPVLKVCLHYPKKQNLNCFEIGHFMAFLLINSSSRFLKGCNLWCIHSWGCN